MKLLRHPVVNFILCILQLYFGLSALRILPWSPAADTLLNKFFGVVMLASGLLSAYQMMRPRKLFRMDNLGPDLHSEIGRLLGNEKQIEAIKLVRERTGLGLMEAKDIVDEIRKKR
jgi:hypothetical protein